MSSNLGRFNTQLENMLNDLLKLFPDFMEIKIFREKFLIAKKSNPKMILLVFLKYIYPYKQYILDQNDDFFLSDNLTKNISNNKEIQKDGDVDNEYILTKALNIKQLWKRMDQVEKETLWMYFKVLIVLCERYVGEHID